MKVLFLDLDGVVNSRRTAVACDGYPYDFSKKEMERFDPIALKLIRKLCEETGCSVVLSSDWRYSCTVHEVANGLDLPVIDFTPVKGLHKKRGEEIAAWMFDHPEVTQYAIVDDNNWMLSEQQDNFVQTNEEIGLTLRDYLDLKAILMSEE